MNKVLVIDDDRSVIHLIQSALRNEPEVEVVAASSAEQGIARVAEGGIDAVLLDVMLPDLSGLDAYKQLRQHDAKMPVIFITVGGTSDTAIEAMKLGAFDYLLKPLDLERVRELVRQALEMRRLMRDPVAMQNKDEVANRRRFACRPHAANSRGIQSNWPRCAAKCYSSRSRRKWHRQGTGGPRYLSSQFPSRWPLFGRELCRADRNVAGKRVIRA